MDPVVERLYRHVEDLLPRDAFLAKLAERREEYADLLDDEALALHILDELNRNEGAIVTLDEVRGRAEATVRVDVERLDGVRDFNRKDGRTGRVANVTVRDATGEARLVLWDRDVEKIEDKTLQPGDRVKVVNARVKDSRWGLELHVTRWTVLEVAGAPDPAKKKLLTDTLPDGANNPWGDVPKGQGDDEEPGQEPEQRGYVHEVTLRLVDVEPTRPFQRNDGTAGFVANARVEDQGGNEGTLVAWDDHVLTLRRLKPGDVFLATRLSARERDGQRELHTTGKTTLEKATPDTAPASDG